MNFTDQQLCIIGLFILAIVSLIVAFWMNEKNQAVMITITSSVVSGILGYLKGKE